MVYITRIACEFGDWELRATEQGLCGVSDVCSFVASRENAVSKQAAEELLQYFRGERTAFSVPLDLQGTPFQRSVWEMLCAIPYGSSVCYSQVAQRIGRPTAARAVAQAIGKNPCLVFVPCHRVLGKDGSLTGFSAGLELKKKLLKLEHIPYL